MSLTAVPVFLWGRRLMSEAWALVAAVLTLTIPGLAYSGLLMTETVFVPAVTLAAWAMWRVLLEPSPRTQAFLLGAIALAVLTRLQGLVLVPVFILAVLLYAGALRSWAPLRRLAPALGAITVLALVWLVVAGFGAYGPAGKASYNLADSLRFVLYHAADAVLLVGVVPACAVVLLATDCYKVPPALRAYLAVAVALTLGLVLPLGKLVHKAALPDAFSLVPVWELGSYDAVVWGFAGAAALAFALLPRTALVGMVAALALVFAATSVEASR